MPNSQLDLPSSLKNGLLHIICLSAVRESEVLRIPIQLSGNSKGYGGEGKPFGVGP